MQGPLFSKNATWLSAATQTLSQKEQMFFPFIVVADVRSQISWQPTAYRAFWPFSFYLCIYLACCTPTHAATPAETREQLVQLILAEDQELQIARIKKLSENADPTVEQILGLWRQGGIYVFEAPDGKKVPFTLDPTTDADGKGKGIQLLNGEFIKDEKGQPTLFQQNDLTAADTNAKLRKAIKITLDLLTFANPNPNMRRDAITKLGLEQNTDYLPFFEARAAKETDPTVKKALIQAVALIQLANEKPETRVSGIRKLEEIRSIEALEILKKIVADAKTNPAQEIAVTAAAKNAVHTIEGHIKVGNFFGTAFRGLSLSAVLLVAALGLAITFGLMGVINMAHGEMIMVGAYSAYVAQNIFIKWFGSSGTGFNCYFIFALVLSFVVAGAVGLALERGVIRFLYKRPLESLLATWGVSLVLQQVFRSTFGAANVQVSSPTWLSGSFVVSDVLFAYNRLFVIGFALFIVFATYLLLTKTSAGLQIRAVMQNRNMASCIGVRTDRVNMITFAFGSGLAGVAGACLSQIGNVGPSLGQAHIVDCFMVVVLGGVGNLVGTIGAALGIGVTDQILQPFLGAVLGKITVLAGIILFLQWRPAGLFVTRSRSLEG
ncbi:MAG: urea transporter permease [Verrucomicrobiales bacterium]|nr:urea transporter permease [Verrucomicrobiales bacterium]